LNSIIIRHQTEKEALDQSIMGQRLDKELTKCLNDNLNAYTNAGRLLAPLLKINNLSNEVIMVLLRPWYNPARHPKIFKVSGISTHFSSLHNLPYGSLRRI
jgi:hypothetical protein